MKKFMDWMTNKFAPKMNKLARNPWIASVQEAILTAMPMIFIGSFTTILTAFGGLIDGFPDFSPLSTFSLGLLSLYLAYLVPYLLMEKKRHNKTKKEAGLAGIGFFLMLVGPTFDEAGNILFQSAWQRRYDCSTDCRLIRWLCYECILNPFFLQGGQRHSGFHHRLV